MLFPNQTLLSLRRDPRFAGGKGWITYFTPTWNRASFLERPYQSLLAQTDTHFVWVVVIDGSTDASEEEALRLLRLEQIPMLVCSRSRNEGKHKAFRYALERCETEFFACMDDDDRYAPEATACFLEAWKALRAEGPADVGAVRARVQREDGSLLSAPAPLRGSRAAAPERPFDCSTLDFRYKFGLAEENWTCYSVEALRSVDLFSEGYYLADRHRFFSEAVWQGRFARRWRCRYIPEVLRTYSTDAPSSLSRPAPSRQALLDKLINNCLLYREQYDYIGRYLPLGLRLRRLLWMSSVRSKLGLPWKPFVSSFPSRPLRRWLCAFRPLGALWPRPSVPRQ